MRFPSPHRARSSGANWSKRSERRPQRNKKRLGDARPLAVMAATPLDRLVRVPAGTAELEGNLRIHGSARAIVVFAHGSGSSRHSPRNRFVADHLASAGLGTLLIDLLTRREEIVDMQNAELRFDIRLLAGRLEAVTDWLAATRLRRPCRSGTSAHRPGPQPPCL